MVPPLGVVFNILKCPEFISELIDRLSLQFNAGNLFISVGRYQCLPSDKNCTAASIMWNSLKMGDQALGLEAEPK